LKIREKKKKVTAEKRAQNNNRSPGQGGHPDRKHKRQKQETEKSEAKHAKRVNEINLHKNEIYFRPEHCGDEAENRCSLVHEVKDNDRDKGQGGPQPQRNTKHPGKGRGMDCLT
jgi:hypothetical protein